LAYLLLLEDLLADGEAVAGERRLHQLQVGLLAHPMNFDLLSFVLPFSLKLVGRMLLLWLPGQERLLLVDLKMLLAAASQ
jgi:hypothetical protein